MNKTHSDKMITSTVARQFIAVRDTGLCNMLNAGCVTQVARKIGHTDLADRIDEEKSVLSHIVAGEALVEHNDEVLTMDEWTDLHDF